MRSFLSKAVLLLGPLSLFATISIEAQNPISYLLRANGYTPVVDHESDIVPGMLLVINWDEGTSVFLDPEADALGLHLMPPLTRKLTKMTQTKVKGVDAATSGLKAVIGFDPAVKFSSNNKYTFSGISFTGLRLRTQDWQNLMKGGATYDSANKILHKGRNDVFIITEVDSTDAVTVSSSKSFSVAAGDSTTANGNCTPAPASAATTDSTNNSTDDKTSSTTVKDAKEQVAKVDAKAKDESTGTNEMGGHLGLCAKSDTTYEFTNTTPVPAALKVVRVVLSSSDPTAAELYLGDAAVPLGDQKLLHRSRQLNDNYNPPKPKN